MPYRTGSDWSSCEFFFSRPFLASSFKVCVATSLNTNMSGLNQENRAILTHKKYVWPWICILRKARLKLRFLMERLCVSDLPLWPKSPCGKQQLGLGTGLSGVLVHHLVVMMEMGQLDVWLFEEYELVPDVHTSADSLSRTQKSCSWWWSATTGEEKKVPQDWGWPANCRILQW